jgi:7-cyano-7-deazaguanine synthase
MKTIEVNKSVVIFSGGQDSTTCLYWAISKFGPRNVEAITFSYGQKHLVEIEQSKIICKFERIKQTIVDISFLNTLVDSALTSNGDVNKLNAKGLPSSFVPNRNALFITLAHAYAQKIGATELITGVCQTDYSGYPDCRISFITAIEKALCLGSEEAIVIHTPLMYLNKKQTWDLARKLNCITEVVELSHTCYNGDRSILNDWGYGCGICPACELRRKGYYEYIDALEISK